MMIENLEKMRSATNSYVDLVERTMRGLPSADQEQISTFKAYIERQVAANHALVDKLLRAKDFQEALRIQVEHFQLQLKATAEDTAQMGARLTQAFKRPAS
jgi:hypothetical protein